MVFKLGKYLTKLALKSACYEQDEGLPSAERGLRCLITIADLEAKFAQFSAVTSALSWEVWLLISLCPGLGGLFSCLLSLWEYRVLGMLSVFNPCIFMA